MTHSRVETSEAERAINDAYGIAIGQKKAMDLKNTPANHCNPEYLRDQALDLGKNNAKVKTTCLTEKEMHKLGMHCLLSVGRGSAYGSYLVTIEYKGGAKDESPIAFVGKGVTFDAGGIDLKPAKGMAAMKMDMGGAAGVLGTMESIIELDLPINVIGVVAIVENVIGSNAYRPSDVLTSMSGQTVEVLNTDAEGRLILCDALTYVEKFNPRTVIDLATLTGAIIVSLGPEYTGLFGNHNPLINELLTAGQSSTDYSWHLPMPENYNEYLESEVADMTNVGSTNAAGSILAAMFLSKFTKKYKWAHLDVAASAMGGLEKPKATGRPVPMLVQYVLNQLDHSKTG
jgi:leucyl aminopeptidase